MVQINDDYYEDLDGESTEEILDALARGRDAEGRLADRPARRRAGRAA